MFARQSKKMMGSERPFRSRDRDNMAYNPHPINER